MNANNKVDIILSIIIVSYNRLGDLKECLHSIKNCISNTISYEIIVIDNGSLKGCQRICNSLNVIYIDAERNRGVSGGRNLGIQIAQGKYLFFIDDDATMETIDFDNILVNLERSVGIVAFKVLNYQNLQPNPGELPFRDRSKLDIARRVSYFVGATFLVRKEVFERIGLFPEHFFYGAEEIDLSYRAINDGWEIAYNPNVVVHHKKSPIRSTNKSKYYHILRNRFEIACKFLPFPYFLIFVSFWAFFLLVYSIQDQAFKEWKQGWIEGYKYWKKHRKTKSAVLLKQSAIRYLKKNEGRLWY